MARTTVLVLGAALASAVVTVTAFQILTGPAPASMERVTVDARATAPASEDPLRQELARRDREIERLQARLAALEASPPRERQPAPPPRAPEPEAPAAQDALAWLQRLDPERYAHLTAAAAQALRELDLRGRKLTDAQLQGIASLTSLGRLNLRGEPVTDAGMVWLAGLEALRTLELRGTQLHGDGLQYLPAALEHLDLTDTQVAASELSRLGRLGSLRTLDLNRIAFSDAAVESLGRCPMLRHLELDGTEITDQGLRRLLELNPQLERLEVRDTKVSPGVLDELRRSHPGLVIVHEAPLATWR